MPSINELQPKHRMVMASINGHVKIDPKFCDHRNVAHIATGHVYTILGEYDDNFVSYDQCLDCGAIIRDDRTWGAITNDDDKEPLF